VSELRKATPGGWSMSCAELVSDATILEQLTDELARCIASDDCESAGYVGFDFTNTSRSTATMYATFPLQQGGALNFISDSSGDLGGMSSAGVRLAYGQKNSEEYEDEVMDEILANDMILVQGSMAVSLFFLLLNTRSLFMSLVGLLQVGFSFPVAYFFYKLVFGFSFFPFLNFLGLFVIMGIGVDDLFVVTDKWAQAARRLGDGASEVNIAAEVGPDAAFTMLLTSITTAAAFFATSVVPVAPIRLFALFMGFMVLADYLLCLVMSFPACVLQHRWVSYARKTGNKCVLGVLDFSSCCTGPPSGRPKMLDRFMSGPMHSLVRTGRFVLIVIFAAAIGVCAWKTADIPLPSSSEVQLLPDSHVIQQFNTWRKDLQGSSDGSATIAVVWGLKPKDTGDHLDPTSYTDLVADASFDPSATDAQQWLLDFCSATAASPLTLMGTSSGALSGSCVLHDMDGWLRERASDPMAAQDLRCGNATQLPVPQADFHTCASDYLSDRGYNRRSLRMYNGKVAVIGFHFRSDGIRWDSAYEELRDAVKDWDDWVDGQTASAPAGVSSGFPTCADFHWWDTNRSMLEGAYLSILTALVVVAIVVFLATLNLITTLYATVAVAGVLVLVIGTVTGLGWELGFLEGICFAILIGLSCDFVLHMAHAYTSSDEPTREAKSKEAITFMGPPVFAAAITTGATGMVMFGCTILFFLRFGTILVLTMVYAILTSLFFFLALTNAVGPTGNCCSLAPLCPARAAKTAAAESSPPIASSKIVAGEV